MNRLRQIAVAAAIVAVSTVAPAQSSVRIYGLLDAAVEYSKSGNGHVARLVSGGSQGSRLGFTGEEDLGGGLKAVFRLESGLTIDDGALGQGGRIFGREASVGLSSRAGGTVMFGRLPTPYYLVQNGVDAFIWEGGGSLNVVTRSTGGVSRQLLPYLINARADNAIGYQSPTIWNVTVRGVAALGEGSATQGRSFGASARYQKAPFDVLAGWNRQLGANNANGDIVSWVVGGNYDFGAAKVFAGYTQEKNGCTTCTGSLARLSGVTGDRSSKIRLLNVGTRIPVGSFTAIAQVVRIQDRSQYTAPTGNRDATEFAVGLDYDLSKRTHLYSTFSTIGNRNGSAYAIGSGSSQQPATYQATAGRTNSLAAGVRHTF